MTKLNDYMQEIIQHQEKGFSTNDIWESWRLVVKWLILKDVKILYVLTTLWKPDKVKRNLIIYLYI